MSINMNNEHTESVELTEILIITKRSEQNEIFFLQIYLILNVIEFRDL